MVSDIYTVAEIAEMLNISKKTVYRYFDKYKKEFDIEFVNVKENDKGVKVKYFTEKGLTELKKELCVSAAVNADYDNLVNSLLEQLKAKDIQLAEKDKQISMLMEQAKNYQVLLQGQQYLSLPEKKKSFIKRLFGSNEE